MNIHTGLIGITSLISLTIISVPPTLPRSNSLPNLAALLKLSRTLSKSNLQVTTTDLSLGGSIGTLIGGCAGLIAMVGKIEFKRDEHGGDIGDIATAAYSTLIWVGAGAGYCIGTVLEVPIRLLLRMR